MMVPGMCSPGKAGVLLSIQHHRKDVAREQRRVEDQERVSISKASSVVGSASTGIKRDLPGVKLSETLQRK